MKVTMINALDGLRGNGLGVIPQPTAITTVEDASGFSNRLHEALVALESRLFNARDRLGQPTYDQLSSRLTALRARQTRLADRVSTFSTESDSWRGEATSLVSALGEFQLALDRAAGTEGIRMPWRFVAVATGSVVVIGGIAFLTVALVRQRRMRDRTRRRRRLAARRGWSTRKTKRSKKRRRGRR